MKRFNWLMTLLAVVAVAFTACKEDEKIDPQPQPGGDDNTTELTFNVELGDISKNSLTYNVTPSDLEADYLAVAFNAASVEQCATDEAIVEMVYANIKAYAESIDKTFDAYMKDKISKGAKENATIDGLTMDTNYYLLLFGVDSEKEYAATSAVSLTRFKTATVLTTSCTFELKATPYLNNASITVTPSINTQAWSLINIDIDTYTTYTSAEGEYQWTNEQLFVNHLQTQIDNLKAEGLSTEEINTKLIFEGKRTLYAGDLQPKTKYVCFVAGVDFSEDGLWMSTAIKELRYNSGEKAENNLTFDIEVFNIDHYSAEIRITPSDPNAEYYYYISYINTPKKSMKPIELAESAVNEYIYYWENYTELKHRDPVKGVQELTGDNKVELNIAETEYYIVAFSYELNPTYGTIIDEENGVYDENPGTITSAPAYVSFMTSEQGDPMKAEFTFKASEVGPYDFTLEIDASDPTIYYQPGIAYADSFDAQAAINASAAQLAQVMEMCMQGQSPSLTIQEALEEKCNHLYRNGDGKYYIANLFPETDYIGYVLAIDTKTGKFARCVYSDVIASTLSVGKVNPTIELLGVYNGNDENGLIFGNAELTNGRPIIAVKHTNFDGASALFGQLSEGNVTDAKDAKFSDQHIISEYRGYWMDINLNVPYGFYVANWDMDHTAIAYACDANGHEGQVGRLLVKPVTPGDINELKGYVNELNAAIDKQPEATAKSLVIAEVSEPTIECLWSEEVGAPRAAKVTKHKVEPLVQQSDITEVKVIKAFRF